MNFAEAESYLYSLGNEVETMKLGLANVTTLLDELGRPQEKYLKVQVAGTNGKGSVCAFLGSICMRANIRAGVFTSPHLISVRERISIDGADINEADFARVSTQVRDTAETLVAEGKLERVPTFFEQITAIALLAFAEAKVELAILETGLGGRLDATTAANAEIAAITRIDLDHQEYLGDTIEKIAAEKAAIIRPGSKVVIGRQRREAERVITGRCREVGIEPIRATDNIVTELNGEPAYPIYTQTFRTERAFYPRIDLGILGRHQAENAAIALAVIEILQDEGYGISEMDLFLGLSTAEHPGRLEFVNGFLLDGAHNPAGALSLARFLDDFVPGPVTLVFGAMREKNVEAIAEILFPKAERIILTRPENSRAIDAGSLTELAEIYLDRSNVTPTNSVSEALEVAREQTPADLTAVVTGSLYLVGEARRILTGRGE